MAYEKEPFLLFNCYFVFFFYQCNNSDIVNSEKLHNETFSAVMNSNTTFAENKRARAEANKLIFYDNDFLQTKEPMSDNAIPLLIIKQV